MFKWLRRDPVAALKKQYNAKLLQARDVQRNGDIVKYSEIIAESEEIWAKIESLQKSESQQ